MRKFCWAPVVICSLLAAGCTGLNRGPQASVYPNSRVLQCSCDTAWPELLQSVSDKGFRLVAKDDAGFVARFLYLEPQLPVIISIGSEADSLAIARDGSGQKSGRLRIQSAVLALAPRDSGCEARISVSYQGQDGFWGRSWTNLESSGLLENKVLSALTFDTHRAERRPTQRIARRESAAGGLTFTPTIIGGDLARQ